jgi:MFS family permease
MWMLFIVFGLFGQIAWAVENMYFNLFIYNTIAKSTKAVTIMVQASGIAATITTLFAGTLSDKVGNRKHFISIGYILWGLSVLAFAFINVDNVTNLFNIDPTVTSSMFGLSGSGATKAVAMTLLTVIVMDCVMTFFGSTANDASFNAFVTDNTDTTNRGLVEGVLSAMPLLALLIVAGGFGLILGEDNNYPRMFIILGSVVTASGIFGLFVIKDAPTLVRENKGNFFKNLAYGFLPKTIKANKPLYIVLFGILVYSIASNIFMPYLIIYMERFLKFTVLEYSAILASMILLAAVAVVFLGKLSDKIGKEKMLVIAGALFVLGLFLMSFVHSDNKAVTIGLLLPTGFAMLIGFLLLATLFGAMVKNYIPENNVGKLQGVRMCFAVLLPMFIGPLIGDSINQWQADKNPEVYTYLDETTQTIANIPAPQIFLAASLVGLLVFVPIVLILIYVKNHKNDAAPLPIENENL